MKKSHKIRNILIVFIILLLVNITTIPSQQSQIIIDNDLSLNYGNSVDSVIFKVFFVIGIGMYWPYQGTWPVVHEIMPIILLRIGLLGCKILVFGSPESIDFAGGDRFIGYYPFYIDIFDLFPFGIGFVCGIWFDKQ